jgi:hypothetical protein
MSGSLDIQPCRIQGRQSATGGRLQHRNAFRRLGAGQRGSDRAKRHPIAHHLLDLGFFLQLPAL